VVSIVGTDEIDLNRNYISWASPLGRAFIKSAAGDSEVGILSCCFIDVPRARDRFGPIRLLESRINAWVLKW